MEKNERGTAKSKVHGDNILAEKFKLKPNLKNPKLGIPSSFGIRIFHGGEFQSKKSAVVYVGGSMIVEFGICYAECNFRLLNDVVCRLMKDECTSYKVWYRMFGRSLATGRKVLASDDDVRDVLKSIDKMDLVTLYVVHDVVKDKALVGPRESSMPCAIGDKGKGLAINENTTVPPTVNNQPPLQISFENTTVPPTAESPLQQPFSTPNRKPFAKLRRSPRGHPEIIPPDHSLHEIDLTSDLEVDVPEQPPPQPPLPTTKQQQHKSVTHQQPKKQPKKKPRQPTKKPKHPQSVQGQTSKASKKGIRKRQRGHSDEGEENFPDPEYVDSEAELSDAPLEADDFEDIRGDDLFGERVIDLVGNGVSVGNDLGLTETRAEARLSKEIEGGFTVEEELEYESDVPGSIYGSDEEVDPTPVFNPEVDFRKPIQLCLGLRFPSVQHLREALNRHAVELGYDFWALHNGRSKFTAYCVNRCGCEWDKKRSKKKACTCGKVICDWKLYAKKMKGEHTMQIRTLRLNHTCFFQQRNRKITSKYLADKYLEDFRTDPTWHLMKGFGARVLRDTGVECGYYKLWFARARAKIILYGDGADQYKVVWNYVAAIRKVYEGSTAIVSCDNIQVPPPTFQRMFICLKPVLDGFKRGCRPIIGVDGCHLTGAYPGICLVAVGSDGNNNIYPLAWAVVEVEKADTWTWFLDLLSSALGTTTGKGYTFMSDRQKGLLQAFENVVPQAEIRYCWRHIWSNFKLRWNGQLYKEVLWAAAKASKKDDFDKHMVELKFLNIHAHAYMEKIEPQHWSRHAFPSTSKSKMLLNNMCESFNNVLRQVRDKPIITLMEWMRRYVMTRHCQKREGTCKLKGRYMPYVGKHLEWAVKQIGYCILSQSSLDLFEVEYFGDRCIVDIGSRQCTCYNWELTGIPCHHAVAVILHLRGNPEEYVHPYYSKEMYQATYAPVVVPMPGPKHWEKQPFPEPIPPPFKPMPGRPSNKKRRKEPGEDSEKTAKVGGKPNLCGNCKKAGHNRLTCKNPPAQHEEDPKKNKGGRPPSTDPWTVHRREQIEKGKGKKMQQQIPRNQQSGQPIDICSQASNITAAGPSQSQCSPSHEVVD